MKIKKRSNEFRSHNWCAKAREYDELTLTTAKDSRYDNAIIAKEIMCGYLEGKYQVEQFKDLVSQGVEDDYIMTAAGEARQDRLVKCLTRACRSEHRKAFFTPTKELEFDDYLITVKPDAIFDNGTSLDLVIYRPGKPDVTMNGKKKDSSVDQCLELYFLLCYGRTLLAKDEVKTIRANYYFLRRKDDQVWKDDFFAEKGGNIVYLEETCRGGDVLLRDVDRHYLELLEQYSIGRECNDEDCKWCTWNPACNYVAGPEHRETKLQKKKGDIVYSEAQEKVIGFRKGIARVNASAGAGKTECVTERVARLIGEGISPSEILCITFTDAGAREMKERVSKKCLEKGLGIPTKHFQAMTFNAFAFQIVKAQYQVCGFSKPPMVIDDVRDSVIVTQLLDDNPVPGLDYLNFNVNFPSCRGALTCVRKAFSLIKEEHIDTDSQDAENHLTQLLDAAGYLNFMPGSTGAMLELYKTYDQRLKEDCLVQFSDQEPLMMMVLDKIPGYLDHLGFRHIIVDEFQDTNAIQLDTIRRLTECSSFESLMVVGDDSQSIYGFRHTSPEYIIHFFDRLGTKGQDLFLTENRRSTPEIIAFANKINAINEERIEKDMTAVRPSGFRPVVRGFHGNDEEYSYIADKVQKLSKQGCALEDFAFIAYKKAELVKLAAELDKRGIPWVMKNPMPLSENVKVRAALSLAEAFWQPEADQLYFDYLVALYEGNIFDRFTTDEIQEKIKEMSDHFMGFESMEIVQQRVAFHEMLNCLSGGDEIYQYFLELVYDNPDLQSELEYMRNFKRFGENTAKKMEQDYQGVVLTTAHSSKGLEWPYVFLSLTNFDSKQAHMQSRKEVREEIRRLIFVAATRARDQLWITGQYVAYGSKDERVYNQFLEESFTAMEEPYNPIDPKEALKEADRKLKASARRSRRAAKGEMTEEEKQVYREMTKNSYQLSFL